MLNRNRILIIRLREKLRKMLRGKNQNVLLLRLKILGEKKEDAKETKDREIAEQKFTKVPTKKKRVRHEILYEYVAVASTSNALPTPVSKG